MNLTTCFIIFCASHIYGAGNTCNAQSVIKKLFLKLQSRRHETRYAPSFGLSGHFEGTVVGWPRNGCSRLSRTQARRSSSCRAENKAATKLRSTHPFPVSATQYVRGAGHAQYSDHTRMNGKFAFVVLPFHSKACLRPLIVQTITSPLPSNLR